MRRRALLVAAILAQAAMLRPSAAPALAAKPRIAVFGFEMVNTSLMPTSAEEKARLRRLADQLRAALEKSGQYDVIDTASAKAEIARLGSIRECNGCELDLARKLGADQVAFGWVQKVSNLILNINLVIVDVTSGKDLKAGSVSIRGNTDESWRRGLAFLLDDRIFGR